MEKVKKSVKRELTDFFMKTKQFKNYENFEIYLNDLIFF